MTDAMLRVQSQLTTRDLTLLGWLLAYGLLTAPQIAHALFPSLDFRHVFGRAGSTHANTSNRTNVPG